MSVVNEAELWVMICSTEGCALRGAEYPCPSDSIECSGCGTMYSKPE